VTCSKCKGLGNLRWWELDEYDGPATRGEADDTLYLCDDCKGSPGIATSGDPVVMDASATLSSELRYTADEWREEMSQAEQLITKYLTEGKPLSGKLKKALDKLGKKVGLDSGIMSDLATQTYSAEPTTLKDFEKRVWDEWSQDFDVKWPTGAAAKLWAAYVMDEKKNTGPSGPFAKYKKGVHY